MSFHKPDTCIGVGINYRNEIATDLTQHLHHIDFIEINTERFFQKNENTNLQWIIDSIPVVLHGLTVSMGTINKTISTEYLSNLSHAIKHTHCKWFSEHIAVTHVNGLEIRSLMPAAFTEENVAHIVNNAKLIIANTNKPFLLENISYYYPMPTSSMSEAHFINEIINKADCGLLLDLNNLFVNATNHCYDPYDFLNTIPLDHVIEVHLAGCNYKHGILIDTHASKTRKEVLALFDYVCQHTTINGAVIERDANLTQFADLLTEVQLVRNIMMKHS